MSPAARALRSTAFRFRRYFVVPVRDVAMPASCTTKPPLLDLMPIRATS